MSMNIDASSAAWAVQAFALNHAEPARLPAPPVASSDPVADEAEEEGRDTRASLNPTELTPEEERELRELQQRDRQVKMHEQAHVVAGGQYVTRPPSYDYETGPDGRQYAVGGEVSIDTSRPSDPEEAIDKARVVQRAALAPVDPSPQDYRVAAEARQMEAEARRELVQQRAEEAREARNADDASVVSAAQQRLNGLFAQIDRPIAEASLQLTA